jgi:hypothetical protein
MDALTGETLDSGVRAHVDGCARCQTERALFLDFEGGDRAGDPVHEDAEVAWIADATRQRLFPGAAAPPAPALAPAAAPARRGLAVPQWAMALAASVVVAAGLTLLLRPGVTVDEGRPPGAVYRAVGPAVVSPSGDQAAVPATLRWTAVDGAARYAVTVTEVDGTVVWQSVAAAAEVPMPEVVRAAALPARTLVWQVEAQDAEGRRIGEAAAATFRVLP